MQQSFQEMTLLDYAINAALVLSYVAVNKQDKAGLVTFSDQFGLPPTGTDADPSGSSLC